MSSDRRMILVEIVVGSSAESCSTDSHVACCLLASDLHFSASPVAVAKRNCELATMVVERCVVEMVLERGETRHDVVVNGLKEIALCGKVCLSGGVEFSQLPRVWSKQDTDGAVRSAGRVSRKRYQRPTSASSKITTSML